MNFRYYIPTKLLFGRGQINNLHKEAMPGKKALIVTTSGRSVIVNGHLDKVQSQLELAGVEYVVYNKITSNPALEEIMNGAKIAKENGCDFVVGLGGGSPIDASKSIAIMVTNPGNYWDYMRHGTGGNKPVEITPLPIVAVTTTAGTGTEIDPWTVVSNTETNEKYGYGIEGTFPCLAVVDPEMMLTVPRNFTIYQGFDALFHSLEGYIACISTPISDIYALKAISLIGANLAKAADDGSDITARENMALANTLSGMVESTSGCVSEHALEHVLSAFQKDLPHGAGLIMLSVAYFTKIMEKGCSNDRLVDMAKALGLENASKPEDFITALKNLQIACGVENLKMSDYGIKPEDMTKFANIVKTDMIGNFRNDPCELTIADCEEIYTKSYK